MAFPPIAGDDNTSFPVIDTAEVGYGLALFHHDRGEWALWVPCPHCGGYGMPLGITVDDLVELAEVAAWKFLQSMMESPCLGCTSRTCRSPAGANLLNQPYAWWDTETSEWMLWQREGELAVTIPLAIRNYSDHADVEAAALAIMASTRLPLRLATDDPPADQYVLYYDHRAGRWMLRCPCLECQGCDLEINETDRRKPIDAVRRAHGVLRYVASDGCPRCSMAARARAVGEEEGELSRIWFDVDQHDWMMWQDSDDIPGGVTLPLELRWYGIPVDQIHRAARELFDH